MTPQQALPYRQQLLKMHSVLLEQIATQRGGVLGQAEVAANHFERREDSSAQVATERELEFAIGERETSELTMIEAALARTLAGTYGDCIDCGSSISKPRLQASPEAPRCIACQEKFEQQAA